MKRWTTLATVAALCLATVQVAASETLTIPATNSTGVVSSPLQAGVMYQFQVSGTYQFSGAEIGDAEWLYINNAQWVEYDPTPPGEWNNAERDVMDVFINDHAVSWLGSADGSDWSSHTYSPSHVYRYWLIGTGIPVKFHIADPTPLSHSEWPDYPEWYGDNIGQLILDITPVPEPSSLIVISSGMLTLLAMRRRRT